MENKILVKFNDNWADEMDVEGFKIFTKTEWEAYKSYLERKTSRFEVCIGTNEELRFRDGKECLGRMTVSEIPHEHAQIIEEHFDGEYGERSVFYLNDYDDDEE